MHHTVGTDFRVRTGIGSAPAASATTSGGPATDAEEDGMPKEDPSKLERASGEENEEVRKTPLGEPIVILGREAFPRYWWHVPHRRHAALVRVPACVVDPPNCALYLVIAIVRCSFFLHTPTM